MRSGLKLRQALAVAFTSFFVELADHASKSGQPASPSAPLIAIPILTQLS